MTPVIASAKWSGEDLLLSGTGAGTGVEAVLRRRGGSGRHIIPVTRIGDGFQVVLPVAAMPEFGSHLPLRDGRWELTFRDPAGAGPRPEAGRRAELAAAPTPGYQLDPGFLPPAARLTAAGKRFECVPAAAGIAVRVAPVLRLAERGRIRRKLLREVYYPLQRLLPLRDQILLRSFDGKQCGDNPGGIAAELRRRDDPRPRIWVIADRSIPVPPGERAVLTGTMAYFAALARSRHLISNDHTPRPFRKRAGQFYAQTWHGAPFKRIGYDIDRPAFASGRGYFEFMAADVADWDLLLSPDPFATPILREAFRYPGEICESGYPRDDELLSGAPDRARDIRLRLGVPDGRKVALYAPTWRDDSRDAAGAYQFDLRLDLAAARDRLAGDYVLLVRGHHLMASGLPRDVPGDFAIDVTSYPDIADLLLVTDVLITDYSSVIFDFAPSGRPILLFTYDLDRYRDQLRGFYLDVESVAPGPLLATSDEVIDALAGIAAAAEEHADRVTAFRERFCSLNHGKAGARACDRIFGE